MTSTKSVFEEWEETESRLRHCRYGDLVLYVIHMLPKKDRSKLEEKFAGPIYLLQRIGYRMCEEMAQGYKDDFMGRAVAWDSAWFVPSKDELKLLAAFSKDLLCRNRDRLTRIAKSQTREIDKLMKPLEALEQLQDMVEAYIHYQQFASIVL